MIFVLSIKSTAPLVHKFLFFPFVFAFSVPGDLHIHHITTGSGAVDGARIGGDERFAASFAESDAQVFIREHFCKTDVDSALKGVESPNPFCGSALIAVDHLRITGCEVIWLYLRPEGQEKMDC